MIAIMKFNFLLMRKVQRVPYLIVLLFLLHITQRLKQIEYCKWLQAIFGNGSFFN